MWIERIARERQPEILRIHFRPFGASDGGQLIPFGIVNLDTCSRR